MFPAIYVIYIVESHPTKKRKYFFQRLIKLQNNNKMTGNLKANTVCSKVLTVLKESNLNYLVNETPYSAFVTIRKTFVKQIESSEVSLAYNDISSNELALSQENLALKSRIKGLESDKGHLRIDIENLELSLEALEVKNDNREKK